MNLKSYLKDMREILNNVSLGEMLVNLEAGVSVNSSDYDIGNLYIKNINNKNGEY